MGKGGSGKGFQNERRQKVFPVGSPEATSASWLRGSSAQREDADWTNWPTDDAGWAGDDPDWSGWAGWAEWTDPGGTSNSNGKQRQPKWQECAQASEGSWQVHAQNKGDKQQQQRNESSSGNSSGKSKNGKSAKPQWKVKDEHGTELPKKESKVPAKAELARKVQEESSVPLFEQANLQHTEQQGAPAAEAAAEAAAAAAAAAAASAPAAAAPAPAPAPAPPAAAAATKGKGKGKRKEKSAQAESQTAEAEAQTTPPPKAAPAQTHSQEAQEKTGSSLDDLKGKIRQAEKRIEQKKHLLEGIRDEISRYQAAEVTSQEEERRLTSLANEVRSGTSERDHLFRQSVEREYRTREEMLDKEITKVRLRVRQLQEDLDMVTNRYDAAREAEWESKQKMHQAEDRVLEEKARFGKADKRQIVLSQRQSELQKQMEQLQMEVEEAEAKHQKELLHLQTEATEKRRLSVQAEGVQRQWMFISGMLALTLVWLLFLMQTPASKKTHYIEASPRGR